MAWGNEVHPAFLVYMWISSCLSTICLECYSFLISKLTKKPQCPRHYTTSKRQESVSGIELRVQKQTFKLINTQQGFPDRSAGKESSCNTGDSGPIPGSGRSPGEGIGYPLQYSWAFLVAQLVKNPPAIHKILVLLLGQEVPLEKGMATLSSILAWRIPWTEEHDGLQPMGLERAGYDWMTKHNIQQEFQDV